MTETRLLLMVGACLLTGAAFSSKMVTAQVLVQPANSAAQPQDKAAPLRYQPNRFTRRAGLYYDMVWGVDSLNVKWTGSGEIIRFAYRVLDADKASALNDKKSEPSLVDPRAGVRLVIPSLELVGQLRQSSAPIAGRTYWMAFSNKGRLVKRGDRVSIMIGKFRAEGLVVE